MSPILALLLFSNQSKLRSIVARAGIIIMEVADNAFVYDNMFAMDIARPQFYVRD